MKSFTEIVGNTISKLIKSFWFSCAAAGLTSYLCLALFHFNGTDPQVQDLLIPAVTIQLIAFTLYFALNYHKGFHKYDSDLIGKAFIGISKKCRIFADSLERLTDHKLTSALDGFKLLEEEYSDDLDTCEQAVLRFYIGRCYDIMGYFPNALKCYQDSQRLGMKDNILPLLIARCTGSNGDTGEAVQLYTSILSNKKSPYRLYVRTDLGKMFLRENDAATAMKWFSEAIEHRQNYADALGGAAIAQTMLHHFKEAEELYKAAIVNRISDSRGFTAYYKEVQAAALLELHRDSNSNNDSSDTKGVS
ncbi:MAG: tetratricopeptide repeat protein [Ruminococcus sp.]|jgi:tetratricopeptide (TPR) repeat protein|nr:tetratricopeptide repeat protein [Ruminococcus sp.]